MKQTRVSTIGVAIAPAPKKIPGEAGASPGKFTRKLTLFSRALEPVAAAEAEAAGPGRPRSPGSPNRPGTSGSQAAAEPGAAEAAEAEAAGPLLLRRS